MTFDLIIMHLFSSFEIVHDFVSLSVMLKKDLVQMFPLMMILDLGCRDLWTVLA